MNPRSEPSAVAGMLWPWASNARSLRFRLTFWNAAVVMVATVAALYAVRLGVRLTLVAEADVGLREELAVLALAIEELHPDEKAIRNELKREVEGHQDHDWFLELLDGNGVALFRSANVPLFVEGLAPSVQAPQATSPALDFRGPDGEPFLVVERGLGGEGQGPATLRLGTSLQYVDEDVFRLTRTMIPIVLVLLVAAPLGGYLLARQATDPLREIIRTTERLRPSRLGERLRIRGTGDELDQLGETINRFLDVIAGYVRQHDEFVSNAAHELRSPLTAIAASVDLALARVRTQDEYEELLAQIGEECRQLTHLVNQLLALAENDVAAAQVPRGPVSWDETVMRSVDVFSALAEEKEIELVSDVMESVIVSAEPTRLRQVVMNLLDNAIKFTPEGGEIRVSLRASSPRVATLVIDDTGCGVSAEDLPRLFERFFRADKSHSRQGTVVGNGLGLPLCRQIVELFGGTIRIESPSRADGRGTRVIVELPLAETKSSLGSHLNA